MSSHRIFHMASFSRSGETLMLRCLAAHPQIEVVHQIREPDHPKDMDLFRYLRAYKALEIDVKDAYVRHRNLGPGSVLLLKNAVWTHPYPRQGFTLIRNPFSIAVSGYRHVDKDSEGIRKNINQHIRWCKDIDRQMLESIKSADILDGMMLLYQRKMFQDHLDGLPFVRYEEFVENPEPYLRKIVHHLGLDWSDEVLRSHEHYGEGELGHGKIKLWRPIHRESTAKYKQLSKEQASRIHALTKQSLDAYGYIWTGDEIHMTEVPGML